MKTEKKYLVTYRNTNGTDLDTVHEEVVEADGVVQAVNKVCENHNYGVEWHTVKDLSPTPSPTVEEKKEDKRRWPAIRAEEKLTEHRKKKTFEAVDGKSEFCFAWRLCLEWINEEYNINPKSVPPSPIDKEKPDFDSFKESLVNALIYEDVPVSLVEKTACDVWEDYITPLQNENLKLREEIKQLKE